MRNGRVKFLAEESFAERARVLGLNRGLAMSLVRQADGVCVICAQAPPVLPGKRCVSCRNRNRAQVMVCYWKRKKKEKAAQPA